MDDQVQRLAHKVWTKYQTLDASQRLLIAIAGIPGSGKTTLAAHVVEAINQLYCEDFSRQHPNMPIPSTTPSSISSRSSSSSSSTLPAIVVPLDGFHLTRHQLETEMPDPAEALFRRGAAFTFDSRAYYDLVRKVRQPIEATTATIYAPSFDHAIKDPVPMDIAIAPSARIVVFEGLYVAMDDSSEHDGPHQGQKTYWRDAAELMDERWFVKVAFPVAADRVARRNFAAGISGSLEESRARTEANDMRNGREVVAKLLKVDEVIESVEDQAWKQEHEQKSVEAKKTEQAQQKQEQTRSIPSRQRLDSIAELARAGAGL